MAKLYLSKLALQDIKDIKDYISDVLQNPMAARRITDVIRKKIQNLSDFPGIGAPVKSKAASLADHRYLVCENYNVYYLTDNDNVYIQRILHGRRDFEKLLFADIDTSKDQAIEYSIEDKRTLEDVFREAREKSEEKNSMKESLAGKSDHNKDKDDDFLL